MNQHGFGYIRIIIYKLIYKIISKLYIYMSWFEVYRGKMRKMKERILILLQSVGCPKKEPPQLIDETPINKRSYIYCYGCCH